VYRRIADTVRTFLGAPNPDYVRWSQVSKLRTEITDSTLEIASVLEKLNTWAARQAKRESREAKQLLEAMSGGGKMEEVAQATMTSKQHKLALRRRAFAQTHGGDNGENP